ncbi:Na+/H+ antiporter subunit E [Aliibacillus thermotolerans]|nr:Na+/H+ antiporter subunit E [Aliibacillus thermotolerans]MDA3131083.1 Na+/H+ antiporter subunit E [Aliibacillus thermotolerans]
MAVQILFNFIIAIIWMFLHDAWNALTFISGYFIGFLFIFALRRFFPTRFYGYTVIAVVKLVFLFISELISSSILVAKQVTRPTINVTPGIFKVHTNLESDWEITLLSSLITLTPGSVVIEIAMEEKVLFIHAMDIPESEALVLKAQEKFERAIMEVTR